MHKDPSDRQISRHPAGLMFLLYFYRVKTRVVNRLEAPAVDEPTLDLVDW